LVDLFSSHYYAFLIIAIKLKFKNEKTFGITCVVGGAPNPSLLRRHYGFLDAASAFPGQ
jgi:hypothetical protein